MSMLFPVYLMATLMQVPSGGRDSMVQDKIQRLVDCLTVEIAEDAKNWDAQQEAKRKVADQLVALGIRDDRVIPLVIPCLRAKNRDARYLAASVLLRTGPKAKGAIPTLIAVLEDKREDKAIREIAGSAVGFQGPEGIPVLAQKLQDSKDVLVRQVVADALGRTRESGPSGIPALIKACADTDSEVRLIAVSSLEQFGKAAIVPLRAALREEPPLVRVYSAEALLRIDVESIPAVVPVLIEGLQNPTGDVRAQAASAWAYVARLVLAHNARPPASREAVSLWTEVAHRAKKIIASLGKDMTDRAIKGLTEALKDSDERVRHGAAEALSAFGPAAAFAVPALTIALGDEAEYVRGYAAMALGYIGSPNAATVKALVKALEDESNEVRLYALYSLGQLGPAAKDAEPHLRKALNDKELALELRAKIVQVLGKITGKKE